MPQIFSLAPADGSPPIWIQNEDFEALKAEAYKVLKDNQGGHANFVINGKLCRVSKPVQVYFIENPEAGKPPMPFNPPDSPSFEEGGKTDFLVPRPAE